MAERCKCSQSPSSPDWGTTARRLYRALQPHRALRLACPFRLAYCRRASKMGITESVAEEALYFLEKFRFLKFALPHNQRLPTQSAQLN